MSQNSEKYRVEWLAADQSRDAGLVEPADVIAFKDIPYGKFGDWNLLDLYIPKDAAQKLPESSAFMAEPSCTARRNPISTT